jgi:gliding motility-associated-like protein
MEYNLYPEKRYVIITAFLISIITAFNVSAQVTVQDSTALVSFFNATSGGSWTIKNNWLSGSNVATWYGITVKNGRVQKIQLPANGLKGAIPADIATFDSLKVLNVAINKITLLPDLQALKVLDTLNVSTNNLSFRSLQPNAGVAKVLNYIPQDSIDTYIDTTVSEQDFITLYTFADSGASVDNNYQWFKDGDSIPGANTSSYSIICMNNDKAGAYTVRVRNIALPGLTLWRRLVVIHNRKLISAGPDKAVCTGSATLEGTSIAPYSIKWTVLKGTVNIVNDTSLITEVNGLAGGDTVYLLLSKASIFCPPSVDTVLVTRDIPPSIAYAGEDFSICSDQALMAAGQPAIGKGLWTVTKGSGIIAQPGSNNTAVNSLSFGENIFRWQIFNGACIPSVFDELKVYRDSTLQTTNAGIDFAVCATQATLAATLQEKNTGVWHVLSGTAVFSDSTSPVSFVSGLSEGSNVLEWKASNSCNSVTDQVIATVYNFLVADAGEDKTVYYSPIHAYAVADSNAVGKEGSGKYFFEWQPASLLDDATKQHPAFLTPDTGIYVFTVVVKDSFGCSASDEVIYTVKRAEVLTVPTLFTPNSDGVNDTWYIPGIESYPDNEVVVMDRNSQVVFKQKGYDNAWTGINLEGFNKTDKPLSADTYFYVLTLVPGKDPQKGFVVIKY